MLTAETIRPKIRSGFLLQIRTVETNVHLNVLFALPAVSQFPWAFETIARPLERLKIS